MRAAVLVVILAGGCIGDFEAPEVAECELVAPDAVALGEPFEVEVRCAQQAPAWFDFDFGDGLPAVRTAAATRQHVYGAAAAEHLWFRVQVFYVDAAGAPQRLETIIDRRFD